MSRLDMLMLQHPLPTWRPLAWATMIALATLVGWSYFARIDQVAVAAAEVIPQGKVKVIQHLEGGIIEAIHVREGDIVRAGAPLVQLDLGTVGVNRDELLARLDGDRLRRARLMAEVGGEELALPPDPAARRPAVALAERNAFTSRLLELATVTTGLNAQIEQKELQVRELEARKRAVTNNLALAVERLKLSGSLLSKGLTARMEHLQLQAEVENLEGEQQTLTTAIPRAGAAVVEAREKLEETKVRFRRQAHEELGTVENSIARLEELLVEATAQGLRAEIRSPIDGVVKNLRYNTIGGVVAAAAPIMEIVPTADRLVIEGKLSPIDRGYVQEGQRAVVKVTAYDFVRFGGLDGTVVLVAPDSSTPQNGAPYFRVIVETDKTYLGDEAGSLPITPGMQATVDIHTDTRTVLNYLLNPVLKLREEAFRER
jgi:adhesin transport system membrane fusion protein